MNKNIIFDLYGMNKQQPVWGDQFVNKISNSKMGLNLSRGEPVKHYSSDRLAQLIGNGLLTFINKQFNNNNPLILIGDTNLSVIKNLPYNILTYNTCNTFPTICPLLTLDRVFYRDLKLTSCLVDKSIIVSDHYPLISEFVLK